MTSIVPVNTLFEKDHGSLFVDTSMELDLKPVIKQQQHVMDGPCLLASTPEFEQALLNFGAVQSSSGNLILAPSQLVSSAAPLGAVSSLYSNSPSYLSSINQTHFRPESSASPHSTSSNHSASVTPSPVSTANLVATSGSRPTAFPFDRVIGNSADSAASSPSASRAVKSGNVHSQCVAAALAGLPLAALDPDTQDHLKKQRKKERNRVAAMKCRKRKLEREADLEEKVSKLKGYNGELSVEVARLRQQVCLLKQTVMKHVNGGCSMVNSDLDIPNLTAA